MAEKQRALDPEDSAQLDLDFPSDLTELRYHMRRIDDKLRSHIQTCREFADICRQEAAAEKKRRQEEAEAYNARHAVNERNFEQTMDAIQALTGSIASLTETTKGIVEAWTFVNTAQRFVKWASAFAILSGAIAWTLSKLHIIP
jgi:hypothetical protein